MSEIQLKNWTIYVEENEDRNQDLPFFIKYASLSLFYAFPVICRIYVLMIGNSNLALKLHYDMLKRILKAPINLYHDITSSGLILNRFTKDLSALLYSMYLVGNMCIHIAAFGGTAIITIYTFPASFLILPIIVFFSYFVVKFWLVSGREMKRVETKTKTPVLNILSESAEGASVIRAMNYSNFYKERMDKQILQSTQSKIFYSGINTFFEFSIDNIVFLCVVLILGLVYLFGEDIGSQNIGLLLSEAVILPDFLSKLVSEVTSFQIEQVSFERCLELTQIIQEKEPEFKVVNELKSGNIEIDNLFIRYREGLDYALKGINLKIADGEKVGICGRTGSGKSTICLSLFRIIEATEGKILIDGQNIADLPLGLLRKSITIIPQDPFLFKGTLRYNIDPLGTLKDKRIKEIMENISCSYICEKEEGLDFQVAEGGDNLSVGEKQLICIARAISRNTRIVVMDEATASIDMKTEELIQTAFKTALKDCTVITVAHRIKTILDCDKCIFKQSCGS